MAENSASIVGRGATGLPHAEIGYPKTAAGTIGAHRLVIPDSTGKVTQATAGSAKVIGVNAHEKSMVTGDTVTVGVGKQPCIADDAIVPGRPIKAGDGGRVVEMVGSETTGDTIKTTGNGEAFTNQPANDGIEVVSANAGDTTQTITIIGTTTGTDTVVVETVTLNGTTPVATTKVDWGQVLAWKKSAATLGTVTIREASADATIATSTAADLSGGVEAVTAADQQAYNVAPTVVANDTTTKQIGLGGTNSAGTQIYDSQALNNTTAVTMNSAFKRVTEVYTGDLEANRTVTVKVGATEALDLKVGKSLGAAAAQGDRVACYLSL